MPPPSQQPMDPSREVPALQAPWRLGYLESLSDAPKPAPPGASCFLREYWLHPEHDVKNNVVARGKDGLILLNAYPYANGHLLVALGEGRPTLLDYTDVQRAALWRLTDAAAALMQEALEPQGINIGVNQGQAAGAGVPQHLHVHLVPRWHGDVNFMSAVGSIRVIPSSLEVMTRRYRAAWDLIKSGWRV